MNDELFNELLESVKQAGDIRKGKSKPSRSAISVNQMSHLYWKSIK